MENIERHLEQGKQFSTNTGITLYSMYRTSIMKIFCLFKYALNAFWKKNCLKTGFYAKNINLLGKVDFIPQDCGHLDQNYYFEKASVRYFDSVQRKSRITVKWRCCNFKPLSYLVVSWFGSDVFVKNKNLLVLVSWACIMQSNGLFKVLT